MRTAGCQRMTEILARDGEGAEHLVRVTVRGARNETEAHVVAKSILNSPLVKTMVHGAETAAAVVAASQALFGQGELTGLDPATLEAALREHRHNVTQAATALGLSRGALYRRMARYGL